MPPSLFCREKGVSVRQWVLGRSIGFRPVHTVLGCQFGPRLGDLSKLDVFRVYFNSSTQILLLPLNCDHSLTLRSARGHEVKPNRPHGCGALNFIAWCEKGRVLRTTDCPPRTDGAQMG